VADLRVTLLRDRYELLQAPGEGSHRVDTCAICQNPRRLSVLAAQESVRALTPGERRTFNVN
jgi:hypothetical protein